MTITMTPSENRSLTALPIHHELRYSVRSSRYGSTLSLGRTMRQRQAGVPSPLAERFQKQHPWVQDAWKTANPPTPVRAKHSSSQFALPNTRPLKQPDMAHVSSSGSMHRLISPTSPDTTAKTALTISTELSSPVEDEVMSHPCSPEVDKDGPDRWSWTNSQAPPTPRVYPSSLRSSQHSLPRFRTLTSWVRSQTDYRKERIDEEQAPPPSRTRIPTLTTVLAPRPVSRKLSKKHKRSSTHTTVFKPIPSDADMAPRVPPQNPVQSRPNTAPQARSTPGTEGFGETSLRPVPAVLSRIERRDAGDQALLQR